MTSVRTNIELLDKAKNIDTNDRESIINDLKTEIEELSLLVDEIVDLATLPAYKSEDFTSEELSSIAEQISEKFSRRSGRVINFDSKGDTTRPMQRSAIERAISNLIDNAIKFSPESTSIDIEVNEGTIYVRDYGIGVKDEDKDQLFKRFFRSVDSRNMPGSGIGLSIVEEIILRHNGHVFVQNPESGAGTIVGFSI